MARWRVNRISLTATLLMILACVVWVGHDAVHGGGLSSHEHCPLCKCCDSGNDPDPARTDIVSAPACVGWICSPAEPTFPTPCGVHRLFCGRAPPRHSI